MDISNVVSLLKESQLSPESLGELMGVSGMTIRRWLEKPNEPLPEMYQSAIREAVFKLVIDGKLDSDSKLAQKVFAGPGSLSHMAALKALGFPEDLQGNYEGHHEKIMVGLSHIGAQESRRLSVEENKKKLPAYKKLGKEWSERITILSEIIASKKLTSIDKFPAYGALFYLFWPFDLIPDSIPVFGLMDDFAILGIAVAYYVSRHLTENPKGKS